MRKLNKFLFLLGELCLLSPGTAFVLWYSERSCLSLGPTGNLVVFGIYLFECRPVVSRVVFIKVKNVVVGSLKCFCVTVPVTAFIYRFTKKCFLFSTE